VSLIGMVLKICKSPQWVLGALVSVNRPKQCLTPFLMSIADTSDSPARNKARSCHVSTLPTPFQKAFLG